MKLYLASSMYDTWRCIDRVIKDFTNLTIYFYYESGRSVTKNKELYVHLDQI